MFTDFGARAVGVKVVKQSPGADVVFSRHEMTMKVTSLIQAAVEWVKMAVNHIAGAIGVGMIKSQDKAVSVRTELEDSFQGRAGHMTLEFANE